MGEHCNRAVCPLLLLAVYLQVPGATVISYRQEIIIEFPILLKRLPGHDVVLVHTDRINVDHLRYHFPVCQEDDLILPIE